VALLAILGTSTASAQTSGAGSPARDGAKGGTAQGSADVHDLQRVTAPVALDTAVAYPPDAEGDAEVVLEITVGTDGHVGDASVISGPPRFATATIDAALHWRFEPATREGRPIAARIRHTVKFEAEANEAPASRSAGSGSASAAQSASAAKEVPATISTAAPLEVTVRGGRKALGSVTVTRNEARNLPGSFGDPLRAIESQPGVIPIVSGVPSFFIRGAPPANVGFFIDGVDVPLLYHAFLGPSVIHPGLIDSVDLYRGASPVEYGRFAGPIVAANLRPLDHRFTGEGNLRLIDVGALVEAPFGACPDGDRPGCSRGSARVSGRYSYTSLVLSLLSKAELRYWDYQGEATYEMGPHDTLSVLSFGAYDLFRADRDAVQEQGGEVSFHRLDLRWDRKLPSGFNLRVALTGGADRSGGTDAAQSEVSDRSLRARVQASAPLGEGATVRAGVDARVDQFGLKTSPLYLRYSDYTALFGARVEGVAGAYAGVDVELAPGITVAPGLRADVYRTAHVTKLGVDPRVVATFAVSADVKLEQSFAIAHQRPNFAAQVPGAQVADLAGGLQQAWLWSSTVRWRLPGSTNFSGSVFRSGYFHALDPIGNARDFSIDRTVLDRRSTITAAGLELGLTRPLTRRVGGFVSYTLSHSTTSSGRRKSVSGFDRPHVLQAALSYDLGRGYRGGIRSVLYSGVPELNLEGSPHFATDHRGSPYLRVDLRLEKRWEVGAHGFWSVVGEILNATSSREVVRLDCGTVCVQREAGPVVLPSVGVEAGF
jgi:TonB family protein